MTPNESSDTAVKNNSFAGAGRPDAGRPGGDDPTVPRALPGYPRIADVLERIRTAAPPEPEEVVARGPYGGIADPEPARMARHQRAVNIVADAAALGGVLVAQPLAAYPQPQSHGDSYETSAVLTAPTRQATVVHPEFDIVANDDLTEAEIEALLADLSLRDTAREALRARLVAFGEQRTHRTAYELVFLMLAFSVTILITAPPLVQVLLAAHGSTPN